METAIRHEAHASLRVSSAAGSGAPPPQAVASDQRADERRSPDAVLIRTLLPVARAGLGLRDQLAVEHVEAPLVGREAPHLDAEGAHRVEHAGPQRGGAGHDQLLARPGRGRGQLADGGQQPLGPRGEPQPHHAALGEPVLELGRGQAGDEAAVHEHGEAVGEALDVARAGAR